MNVGDIRVRISDGVLVEIVSADPLRVVPYEVMRAHGRHSDDAAKHPGHRQDCKPTDFRDVEDGDLK